jgi:hypothetical protein
LVASLVVVLTAFGGTAQAKGRGFTGVVDPFGDRCGGLHKKGNCLSNKDLRRMDRGDVRVARWGFRWSRVEPIRGIYNWRVTDETIGALANRGIQVLPVVTASPGWAAEAMGTPPLATRAGRKGWRRFLQAAVERYGPGGRYWTSPMLYQHEYPDGPVRPINTWQIWNEQNLPSTYVKPRKYRNLVRIAHNAIVGADPHAKILLGGMPGYVHPRAWVYLKKLYKHHGFQRKFDAVALHPYSPDVEHVLVQVKRIRHVMKKHHDAHASLWITELGWGSKHPTKRTPINKGPRGQKRLLKETFPLLKRYRHRWHIPHAYWFRWRDPPREEGGCTFCTSSGLFRHSQKPKPAWRAFKDVTKPRRLNRR